MSPAVQSRRSLPRRIAALVAVAAVTALAACDSVTAPPAGITGSWLSADGRGDGPTGAPMTLVVEQRGSAVTGSGSYVLDGRSVALDVNGTISDRVVVLTLSPAAAGDGDDELLLQGMLSESGERLTAAITLGQATATRVFERR